MGLKEEEYCIGDALKDCGYQTGYIGKWHLDEPDKNHSENPESVPETILHRRGVAAMALIFGILMVLGISI